MGYGKGLDGALELNDVSASASRHTRPQHDSDSNVSSSTLDNDLMNQAEQDGAEDSTTYTAEEERTVVRRLDRRLVLFLALLYLLAFLDRSSKYP